MDHTLTPRELAWPVVTEAELNQILSTLVYERKGWYNCIAYEVRGEMAAFYLDADKSFHVHPTLKPVQV